MKTKGRKIRHRRTKKVCSRKTKRKDRRTKRRIKRRIKRRNKRRTKRRIKRRMRGGRPGISITSPLKPFAGKWGGDMAAFPPGPIYSPGINNDAKFYGKLNNPMYPDPASTHGTGLTKTSGAMVGGKKSCNCTKTNHTKQCNCNMSKCKKCAKHKKRRRAKRGGNMSNAISNNVPGASDIRDLGWKTGEVLTNKWNQWFGNNPTQNTSAGVQPGLTGGSVPNSDFINVNNVLKSAALSAKNYNVVKS